MVKENIWAKLFKEIYEKIVKNDLGLFNLYACYGNG